MTESAMADAVPKTREKICFGGYLGDCELLQLTGTEFSDLCKQDSENDDDNTGLRVHGGSHVLIRFLVKHRSIMNSVDLVEIGSGTGVAAVAAVRCMVKSDMRAKSYLITDGNEKAVQLCHWNIEQELPDAEWVTCKNLLWKKEDTKCLMQEAPLYGGCADLVIGSEMMYYLVDLQALIDTVQSLCGDNGIFVSAHIFRRTNMDTEFCDLLKQAGWSLYEAPLDSFCDAEELKDPGKGAIWHNARMLIAGTEENIWKHFEHIKDSKDKDSWRNVTELGFHDEEDTEDSILNIGMN